MAKMMFDPPPHEYKYLSETLLEAIVCTNQGLARPLYNSVLSDRVAILKSPEKLSVRNFVVTIRP